jgi:hypothetical protein
MTTIAARTCAAVAAVLVAIVAAPAHADRKPLLVQVDHFYVASPDAERLFRLFRDDLGLPEAWPYRNWGSFSSGGLTLGNTAIEFLTRASEGGTPGGAAFKGIAFEPVGDAAAAIAELDARGVAHGPEEVSMVEMGGRKVVGWSTVTLDAIPPAGASIFICDYKARARVAEGRHAASSALATKDGGPLGITSLREIVIGVRSVEDALAAWDRLAETPSQDSGYSFGPGPRIRFVGAKTEGIERIVLGVKSASSAKRFLSARRLLGKDRGVAIDPGAIGGLKVVLVDE